MIIFAFTTAYMVNFLSIVVLSSFVRLTLFFCCSLEQQLSQFLELSKDLLDHLSTLKLLSLYLLLVGLSSTRSSSPTLTLTDKFPLSHLDGTYIISSVLALDPWHLGK